MFGNELIYKRERPKNRVRLDIESMYWLYVWENYSDLFAPGLFQPLSLQVKDKYGRGHDLLSCHMSESPFAVSADVEITASLAITITTPWDIVLALACILVHSNPLPYFAFALYCAQRHYLKLLSTPFITPITQPWIFSGLFIEAAMLSPMWQQRM